MHTIIGNHNTNNRVTDYVSFTSYFTGGDSRINYTTTFIIRIILLFEFSFYIDGSSESLPKYLFNYKLNLGLPTILNLYVLTLRTYKILGTS